MEIIKIPRLRLGQLQTLCETIISICTGITELNKPLEKVKVIFMDFKAAMLKSSASSELRIDLDRKRDKLISGFIYDIKAENYFPHEDESLLEILKEFTDTTNKYGASIRRLPLDEETAAIDNLLTDLEKLDLSKFTSPELTRWMKPIRTTNDAFKNASKDYLSDSADEATEMSASDLVPELSNKLNELTILLFALLQTSPTDELTKVFNEIDLLVNSMK